ncbi:MAG: ATP-dependent helicase RecG, ATP-dependent helicase RecG [Candidatus Parcubacteria bacterium]|jgi:ATP-dependent DNA helicase RecG
MKPTDPLKLHFRLMEPQVAALKRLGITTIEDLLYHFPVRYGDTSEIRSITHLDKGDEAVIFGRITGLKTSKGFKSKIPMADGWVEDESGRIHCVWFNQPYLAKMLTDGALVRVEGKVSQRRSKNSATTGIEAQGELYFSNPKIEIVHKLPQGVGSNLFKSTNGATSDDEKSVTAHNLYPIYPESRGITSNWMYHAVTKIFKSAGHAKNGDTATSMSFLETLDDPIPPDILARYSLPPLRTALIWAHTPMTTENAEVARKRFAFEEIFFIQLEKQQARKAYAQNPTFTIGGPADIVTKEDGTTVSTIRTNVDAFVKRFPFTATDAQQKAIDTVLADFAKGAAMSRLLEGDVGSGKTAVAAATAFAVVHKKLQVAYMCPTEILATQHFESFIQYFAYLGVQVALITGNGCRKFPSKLNPKGWTDISRTQLLKWVENGEIPIVIGTHALIQKAVKFKNLAYVIIDEQHRFGTRQRAELVRKEAAVKTGKTLGTRHPAPVPQNLSSHTLSTKTPLPHLLSMTATPIPRTLALTIYGDLDLTLLDEMPHGRKPIITEIVTPNRREHIYEKVRAELAAGRQAYVICPRIDEADPTKEMAVQAKSVIEETKRLKKNVFPEYEIGTLHSKMKPADKDRVMLDFKAHKIHILCATSVVEVGVNVPNATVIIIEGGERFGLAQLHQLRGRVIRSNHQAYCYVFTGDGSVKPGDMSGNANERIGSEKTVERLRALTTAKNGFELAEFDLAQRGSGGLVAGKQWGVSDIAMEALKNIKMVEAARTEAIRIVTESSFTKHPPMKHRLDQNKGGVHLE